MKTEGQGESSKILLQLLRTDNELGLNRRIGAKSGALLFFTEKILAVKSAKGLYLNMANALK